MDFFFGFPQKDPQLAAKYVERILNMAVVVPGHSLEWGSEAR